MTGPHLGPCVDVAALPFGCLPDPDAIALSLADASPILTKQSWKSTPDRTFRPAEIKVGRHGDALWVWAVLEDADIFNPEVRFNHPFFLRGDVFEVFLRDPEQEAYIELHVGPANQHFQLRIPSTLAFRQASADPESWRNWLVAEPLFASWTWIQPDRQRWMTLLQIPLASVGFSFRGAPGASLLFSFSRYDYTRGQVEPVHSSTSPHRILSFHRQEEWGTLRF